MKLVPFGLACLGLLGLLHVPAHSGGKNEDAKEIQRLIKELQNDDTAVSLPAAIACR